MSSPSEGSRFAVIDSNNQGGILWITASLSLTYFVLSSILRVNLAHRQITKDSVTLVVATVSLITLHLAAMGNGKQADGLNFWSRSTGCAGIHP